ncbi:M42 family metallopeptidase [Staphylospora marina]|uniref:M42 family metallopeptidase n=1 Tax=Staphylospora marina TaxID=2490858 RepID=UPI000F5BC4C3|nr:M42 family metallopeptidase [Staphylospora marina]
MHAFPEERVKMTLVDLLAIPSPTGYAHRAVDFVEKRLGSLGLETVRDNKGGLRVTLNGKNDRHHRYITAHVDTLGAMVKEIKPDGRLKLTKIGGFGWFSVDGAYCRVHTRDGREHSGTILASHTSVHVYHDAEKQPRSDETMEVRLDLAANSAEEVRKQGIRVGDFVSFEPMIEWTETGFIKARHLDDKAAVAVLIELIAAFAKSGRRPAHTTHFYFSCYEEVGFGANSAIPPDVREFLAVDMGALGSGQTGDEFSVSICAKDSSGPYHYGLTQFLVRLAEEHDIRHQVDIYPRYGSDASAAVRAGHDVMHALCGPGVDASHAYERTHRDALEQTWRLLDAYLMTSLPDTRESVNDGFAQRTAARA